MVKQVGPEAFVSELKSMGFAVVQQGAFAIVTLDCGLAGAAGSTEVGTDPPPDFPATPPHWIHLAKGITLPGENGRDSELGELWRKWSRPHPRWRTDAPGANQWLAQVRSLLLMAEDHRS